MDNIDRRLLELLREDSRASFVELGGKVGLSEAAVRRRVKNLADGGVIRRFTVDVEVGHGAGALTLVTMSTAASSAEISDRIRSLRAVRKVYEVTGEHDMAILISGSDISEVNGTIDQIRKMEGVATTNTMVILRELT
ncbi:MAG: Lrp/AsnC family transcriptional regulator [Nitrososphaerota archaeon]|nr:Lrp/AsnC family transcriptional regulator [Nitrososphaerota archaeon]MDG6939386.1 Lrp/AsnC family transcriptional regulator [Nitrososphaerota archaeon]